MDLFSFSNIQQYLFRKPYGIHSPFLYRFASEVIYKDDRHKEFELLESIRKQLKADQRSIKVTDFGKGPRFIKTSSPIDSRPLEYTRKVSSIARHSLQKPSYCRLFFRMVRYFQPGIIIELGTSLGITSCYFALGRAASQVVTLEGCPQTAEIARETFHRAGAGNIELISGEFGDTIPVMAQKYPLADMIYIDGNHSYKGLQDSFSAVSNLLHEKSVVIVDDIRWSKSMNNSWKQLVNHEKTTMALDLGKIGLLFFNPALSKQLLRVGF